MERICSAVAIISHGRLVASGRVDELVAGEGRRRYRVRVEGAPAGWAAAVPGVRGAAERDGDLEVELDDGADDQALLDAARASGRVVAFGPVRPRLADVFREVVEA